MATVTVRKTTLGAVNSGHCGSRNNCYYKGTTAAWELMSGDTATGTHFKTKKLAQAVADYANEIGHDCWNDSGDIEMMFYQARPEYI